MNCLKTGEGLGDPCNEVVKEDVACVDMLEGAAYIGVGYDGRGDYTFNDRKKNLIQRKCGGGKYYQGEQVPDAVDVWGVYDSECYGRTFQSLDEYQQYLIECSGMENQQNALRASTNPFVIGPGYMNEGVQSGNNQRTSGTERNGKKQINFKYTCSVKRYIAFMDEVKPDDLNPEFLQDYLALPWSIYGAGHAQKYSDFLLRWGTHYIKSAVLGGNLSIFKSSILNTTASSDQWTEKTLAETKNMFYMRPMPGVPGWPDFIRPGTSIGENKRKQEDNGTQDLWKEQYIVDNIRIHGGSPESVAMVTEEYRSGFRGDLVNWLKSIPKWPKPYDFKFGNICDLLDINYRELMTESIQPCWMMPLTVRNNMTYYYYTIKNNETRDEMTGERRCYFSGADDFEGKMRHKRHSLCHAIDIYIEEGPFAYKSETIPGGIASCEVDNELKFTIGYVLYT